MPQHRPVLVALLLTACASNRDVTPAGVDLEGPGHVSGSVVIDGSTPEPRRWELDDEMRAVHGAEEYVDTTWCVSASGGVANCVVVLNAIGDTAVPPVAPVEDVLFEKVGPGYEPRVLVLPAGSSILLRNRNSPCRGFMTRPWRNSQLNMMLNKGDERSIRFERAEAMPVNCDLRPYMRGAIVTVDTPYYALTDANGAFELNDVVPGEYRVRVWHEGTGWIKDLDPVVVGDGQAKLSLTLPLPRDTSR